MLAALLLQDPGIAQLRAEVDGLRTSLQEVDDRLAAANRVISSYKVTHHTGLSASAAASEAVAACSSRTVLQL